MGPRHEADPPGEPALGDMTDSSSLIRIIQQVQPDEIYNLAAQSHVKVSFDVPEYTADVDATGTLRMLEAVHTRSGQEDPHLPGVHLLGAVRQGAGGSPEGDHPVLPSLAIWRGQAVCLLDREELPRELRHVCGERHPVQPRERAPWENFVTRKITLAAARIAQGMQDKLYLGNLNSLRDWGYAKDYVECMWLIMQQPKPEDFVIATGEYHTVRQFCTLAFKGAGHQPALGRRGG